MPSEIIEPVTSKCKWLNDYYEGFKTGDYTHIYDNLTSPAENNENQPAQIQEQQQLEEQQQEKNNESINNNNINNKETDETELKEGEFVEEREEEKQKQKSATSPMVVKIEGEEVSKLTKSASKDSKIGIVNMEEQYILIDDNEYEKCSITKFGSTGWYKNQDDEMSFIVFRNKIPKLVVGPLKNSVLRDLVQNARENGYLIACPGTVQGHNGYYVNKKGNVSKWEVVNNDWKKLKLT